MNQIEIHGNRSISEDATHFFFSLRLHEKSKKKKNKDEQNSTEFGAKTIFFGVQIKTTRDREEKIQQKNHVPLVYLYVSVQKKNASNMKTIWNCVSRSKRETERKNEFI